MEENQSEISMEFFQVALNDGEVLLSVSKEHLVFSYLIFNGRSELTQSLIHMVFINIGRCENDEGNLVLLEKFEIDGYLIET